MKEKISSFKDLVIWKMADDLFFMLVDDVNKIPYNRVANRVIDQVIRSMGSISANIAEGAGRGGKKELVRFLIIARGSLTESENWIYRLNRLGYIDEPRYREYLEKLNSLRIKINALIGKLRLS